MLRDLPTTYKNKRIKNAKDVFSLMQTFFYKRASGEEKQKEHFWAIFLDEKKRLLSIDLISTGNIEKVIRNSDGIIDLNFPSNGNAFFVILVHTHPVKNEKILERTIPFAYINLTYKLMTDSNFILDIKVLDHVTVSETDYHSFVESGYMKALELDMLFESPQED